MKDTKRRLGNKQKEHRSESEREREPMRKLEVEVGGVGGASGKGE